MPDEIGAPNGPRKAEGLEICLVEDQCIVYDTRKDEVHYLNATAALVLELCDGRRSTGEIATVVQEAYGLPVPPVDDIAQCVNSLVEMAIVD
ncbi:MAG TPA: PqqD family protein [Bryobacteraceae bacterium]|nr:PqqD family protein [Bryobacteraceae bacterium]